MANVLCIKVAESPEEAPNYNRDEIAVRGATLHTCIVVKRGMKSGKPTIDFQFRDKEGAEFVAMLTGDIVLRLADVIRASQS